MWLNGLYVQNVMSCKPKIREQALGQSFQCRDRDGTCDKQLGFASF